MSLSPNFTGLLAREQEHFMLPENAPTEEQNKTLMQNNLNFHIIRNYIRQLLFFSCARPSWVFINKDNIATQITEGFYPSTIAEELFKGPNAHYEMYQGEVTNGYKFSLKINRTFHYKEINNNLQSALTVSELKYRISTNSLICVSETYLSDLALFLQNCPITSLYQMLENPLFKR